MYLRNSIFGLILIACQLHFVSNELLESQADHQQKAQKHIKPRRKEGSVRLVGGLVEHEGLINIYNI